MAVEQHECAVPLLTIAQLVPAARSVVPRRTTCGTVRLFGRAKLFGKQKRKIMVSETAIALNQQRCRLFRPGY
jgi:hypothetical protein